MYLLVSSAIQSFDCEPQILKRDRSWYACRALSRLHRILVLPCICQYLDRDPGYQSSKPSPPTSNLLSVTPDTSSRSSNRLKQLHPLPKIAARSTTVLLSTTFSTNLALLDGCHIYNILPRHLIQRYVQVLAIGFPDVKSEWLHVQLANQKGDVHSQLSRRAAESSRDNPYKMKKGKERAVEDRPPRRRKPLPPNKCSASR